MLPQSQRLSSSRIDYLLRKGKKGGDASLTVKYIHTSNPSSRFCVIVSSKIAPKAVRRNQIRRQIYEILRTNQHLLPASFDFALIARTSLLQLTYQDLEKAIAGLFRTLTAHS